MYETASSELGPPNPLSRKRVYPFPRNFRKQRAGGGRHTRLDLMGWGSPNSNDWRKSLAFCLLCGSDHGTIISAEKKSIRRQLLLGHSLHAAQFKLTLVKPQRGEILFRLILRYGRSTASSQYFLQLAGYLGIPVIAWNADNSGLEKVALLDTFLVLFFLFFSPVLHLF